MSGSLGNENFQPPLDISVEVCVSSPALVSLVLSKFLEKDVTGQFRILILVAPCWMEASWLPTVLNMLEEIPCQCPIMKDLMMDDSVGWVLKGL